MFIHFFPDLSKVIETKSELCTSERNNLNLLKIYISLVGVAQWIECQPPSQRVTSLIPSHNTCLGYGPGPQLGVHERQPHIDVSITFFLLPFPSV